MNTQNSIARKLLDGLKRVFTPLALMFVVYFTWQSRDLLVDLITDANYIFLLSSILCWVIAHFLSPVFTVLVMKDFSNHLTYKEAFLIHATRLPAKYLPGGIWHTVARAADYKSRDIPVVGIGYYLLLEHLVAASVTLFVGGSIVLAMSSVGEFWAVSVAMIALVAGATLIVLPWVLSLFGSYKAHAVSYLSYSQGVLLVMSFWLFAAISFVLFIKAFDLVLIDYSSVGLGGVYLFSWGVGFVALFAPQGIGVAEFVSGTLLRPEIPLTSFMVLLVSFRINIFIADMATWLIAHRMRS